MLEAGQHGVGHCLPRYGLRTHLHCAVQVSYNLRGVRYGRIIRMRIHQQRPWPHDIPDFSSEPLLQLLQLIPQLRSHIRRLTPEPASGAIAGSLKRTLVAFVADSSAPTRELNIVP